MSKETISATVDPEVAECLDQPHVNTSGLVNDLLKDYFENGGSDVREFRKQQVRSQYEELASRARMKLEEYNELQKLSEERHSINAEDRQRWFEKVRMVPKDTENNVVQQAAKELDMNPQTVIEEAYDE